MSAKRKDIDARKTVKVAKSNTQLVTCDRCGDSRDRLAQPCSCEQRVPFR